MVHKSKFLSNLFPGPIFLDQTFLDFQNNLHFFIFLTNQLKSYHFFSHRIHLFQDFSKLFLVIIMEQVHKLSKFPSKPYLNKPILLNFHVLFIMGFKKACQLHQKLFVKYLDIMQRHKES